MWVLPSYLGLSESGPFLLLKRMAWSRDALRLRARESLHLGGAPMEGWPMCEGEQMECSVKKGFFFPSHVQTLLGEAAISGNSDSLPKP